MAKRRGPVNSREARVRGGKASPGAARAPRCYDARMGAAIWNILLGAVMLVGGLSGRLTLIFTNSSPLLALAGAAILGYGIWQVVRMKRRR